MGGYNSKPENNEALRLCKERKRFIKQAIDSRYALAAAHVCYIESLRNIGVALRRYAEAEVLIESSLSTSVIELDKTPSHSSYLSPSPSHNADISDSPLQNGSPLSPPVATSSYMRSMADSALTVRVKQSHSSSTDEETAGLPMLPPLPLPEPGCSWDYFDTSEDPESFRFVGTSDLDVSFDYVSGWREFKGEAAEATTVDGGSRGNVGLNDGIAKHKSEKKASEFSSDLPADNSRNSPPTGESFDSFSTGVVRDSPNFKHNRVKHATNWENRSNALGKSLESEAVLEKRKSGMDKMAGEKDLCVEREDPSEFITHRAKDFLSSIKDIEHRFFRASESGKEVSRMLEANKIRVGYLEEKGRSSAFTFLEPIKLVCCPGHTTLFSHEARPQTKVMTWKRSMSSRSTSSRNPLTASSKEDDVDDSGSDFVEEPLCMISGSHSSTLDRLYAWERKLYDEVKASESIRKEYDKKCHQLRYLFAKDHSTQVIDKTRAVVKDLHSRIRVAIYSVDSISKRIEKMRDEELQPQLIELIQGLLRMWKAMLECHHAQYITISLAYHSTTGGGGALQGEEALKQILAQLQQEIECFGLCFANWINSLASYVAALNSWLQNCILQPREQSKRRRPFSPRRFVGPPMFILCRDWSNGIKDLPATELTGAIKTLMSDLHELVFQQAESCKGQRQTDLNGGESGRRLEEGDENASSVSSLSSIHSSLSKVVDQLTKFSEASLKMYEDIKQKSEVAQLMYSNCSRPAR